MGVVQPAALCSGIISISDAGAHVSSRGSSFMTALSSVGRSEPSQLMSPPGVLAATLAAGKLASAKQIMSPWPMRARAGTREERSGLGGGDRRSRIHGLTEEQVRGDDARDSFEDRHGGGDVKESCKISKKLRGPKFIMYLSLGGFKSR